MKNIGHSESYQLTTTSKVVVENRMYENEIQTVVKQSLLDQSPSGNLIGVEVISNQQKMQDATSMLINDLNQINQYIVFETNTDGAILHITNYTDLVTKWYPIKEDMRDKYGQSEEVEQFLAAFEKNLFAGEELILDSMKYKGVYGILLSGIYAFTVNPKFKSKRNIKNLFGELDLPLIVSNETSSGWKDDGAIFKISGVGKLNVEEFKNKEFEAMIKSIRDSFNLKVNLNVEYSENYELRQSDVWITEAEQHLKVEVSGIYLNEIHHRLTLKE